MIIGQVLSVYSNLGDVPCPLTEKLIKAGYQQTSGGYINHALKCGIEVNYQKALPTQYWHLMTYCSQKDNDCRFTRSIQCGELILWMAEVLGCVPQEELSHLVDCILADQIPSSHGKPMFDRIKWNREIQRVCFDRIVARVISLK